ncbi:MAG: aminoacyl-tRNA hydrolase, partial [Armatimonadota bacterium]
ELVRHYNVKPENVIVISDDLDLPVGKVRMRLEGGSGGHNGHKSLASALGTNAYPRIRVGIGKSDNPTIDHVLTRFRPDERKEIEEAIDLCVKAITTWATSGPDEAMRQANTPR